MKTINIFKAALILLMGTFLAISCATEPIEDSIAETENLAAKANPLANKTTAQSWADSFEVNGKCYCKSTYDHGIGNVKVGDKTVRQICEAMKADMQKALNGSGKKTYYNTVQCGHEPAHTDAAITGSDGKKHPDEVLCPGEVGSGIKCNSRKGPKWDNDSNPAPSGGPEGYTFAANERGTVTVSGTVDIAYGANGKFNFLRNVSKNTACTNGVFKDPIPGTAKKCYIKSVTPPTNPSGGPEGYTFAANERGTVNVSGTVDIAYGANGKFNFLRNVSKNTACTNGVFKDPIPGVAKKCYTKAVTSPTTPSNNITFASPANGTTLKSGYSDFYIKANVSASSGRSITEVKLYIDGKFIRTERVNPYEWGHNASLRNETTGLSVGTHTLTVEALDSAGDTNRTSTEITVTQ